MIIALQLFAQNFEVSILFRCNDFQASASSGGQTMSANAMMLSL